jgi:hypothetical protein
MSLSDAQSAYQCPEYRNVILVTLLAGKVKKQVIQAEIDSLTHVSGLEQVFSTRVCGH